MASGRQSDSIFCVKMPVPERELVACVQVNLFIVVVTLMFFSSVFLVFCSIVYLFVFVVVICLCFLGGFFVGRGVEDISLNTYLIEAVRFIGLCMTPVNLCKT